MGGVRAYSQGGYIGVTSSRPPEPVRVIRYDPMRLAIVEACDRDALIAAIASHLYRAMTGGKTVSLKEAYTRRD